jgi:hypothetical protein
MIKEAKKNIIKFNEYVSNQMNALASKGETSNDIITNLITGYMAYTVKRFVAYLDKCKDNYKEVKDITYQGIILKAERKYQSQVKNNKCNTLTSKQEKVIVLKAKIALINSFKPKKEYPVGNKK